MLDQKLKDFREKLVLDHFADEVKQDFNAVLSTFQHPHYELIATGAVHDGRDDVLSQRFKLLNDWLKQDSC